MSIHNIRYGAEMSKLVKGVPTCTQKCTCEQLGTISIVFRYLYLCPLEMLHFLSSAVFALFEIIFFCEKFLQVYHQSVKQFGFGPFCLQRLSGDDTGR